MPLSKPWKLLNGLFLSHLYLIACVTQQAAYRSWGVTADNLKCNQMMVPSKLTLRQGLRCRRDGLRKHRYRNEESEIGNFITLMCVNGVGLLLCTTGAQFSWISCEGPYDLELSTKGLGNWCFYHWFLPFIGWDLLLVTCLWIFEADLCSGWASYHVSRKRTQSVEIHVLDSEAISLHRNCSYGNWKG